MTKVKMTFLYADDSKDRNSGALEKEITKHRCFKGFAGDESGRERMGTSCEPISIG
jgi:hypothetical protein